MLDAATGAKERTALLTVKAMALSVPSVLDDGAMSFRHSWMEAAARGQRRPGWRLTHRCRRWKCTLTERHGHAAPEDRSDA